MWSHVYVLPVATVAFYAKAACNLLLSFHLQNAGPHFSRVTKIRVSRDDFLGFFSRHGKTKQKTYAMLQQPLRRNWLVLIFLGSFWRENLWPIGSMYGLYTYILLIFIRQISR